MNGFSPSEGLLTVNDERGANLNEPSRDRERAQVRFETLIMEGLESGDGIELTPAIWADLGAQLFPNENQKQF